MPSTKRPDNDDELIEIGELETPSQGGSSGGELQREIGALDDEKVATGADPQPTSVHKSQKPHGGADPHLPNRQQTRDAPDKAPPRRTK